MNRIVIVGCSSTGKTTLAKKISNKLKITHQELDEFFWEPNWQEAKLDVFKHKVGQFVSGDNWVIDGNYSRVRDMVWERATDVIWLDYSFKLVLIQFFKRSFVRCFSRKELWNGNKENLWNSILKPNSLFFWIIKTRNVYKNRYMEIINSNIYPHIKYHHMKNHEDSIKLLKELTPRLKDHNGKSK